MKANSYLLLISSAVGMIALLSSLREKNLSVDEATQKYNEKLEKQNALLDENQKKAEMWAKILTNVAKSDKERNQAYSELLGIYPNIFDGIDQETAKNLSLADALKLVNGELDKKKNKQTETNFDDAKKNLELAEKEYKDALSKFNYKKKFKEKNKD